MVIRRSYECFEHLAKRIMELRFPFVIDPFHTSYIATSRYIYDRGCPSIDMVTSSILLKPDTLVHWTERSLKNPAITDIPTVEYRACVNNERLVGKKNNENAYMVCVIWDWLTRRFAKSVFAQRWNKSLGNNVASVTWSESTLFFELINFFKTINFSYKMCGTYINLVNNI